MFSVFTQVRTITNRRRCQFLGNISYLLTYTDCYKLKRYVVEVIFVYSGDQKLFQNSLQARTNVCPYLDKRACGRFYQKWITCCCPSFCPCWGDFLERTYLVFCNGFVWYFAVVFYICTYGISQLSCVFFVSFFWVSCVMCMLRGFRLCFLKLDSFTKMRWHKMLTIFYNTHM